MLEINNGAAADKIAFLKIMHSINNSTLRLSFSQSKRSEFIE